MRFLLLIILFILFIVVYNVLSVRRMIKRAHNDRFENKQQESASNIFRRSRIDKSKAEDTKFEEIKEEE